MFITINKVTRESKKDASGNTIKDPVTGKNVPGGKLVVLEETIRMDKIKSVRSWGKRGEEVDLVEGEMCLAYMYGSQKNDQQSAQIFIAESLGSFNKRLQAIEISNGKNTSKKKEKESI